MQEELTNLVHAILRHGIELKTRLLRGEPLILENEQAILKRMLLTDVEARRLPEYGGDVRLDARGDPISGAGQFLGARYALVCWLDELFLMDSPWDARWNENKLELALYGGNDRAWRFWEQARLAESRQGAGSLSAFYLCVMLGFRGEMHEHPAQLQAWTESCKPRLTQSDATAWSRPPELQPATHVPPLRGREALRRMVVSGGTLLLILIPLLAFFLVFLFLQPRDLPSQAGKTPPPAPGKLDSEVP
jgi:type VI secretion system protein ImpK